MPEKVVPGPVSDNRSIREAVCIHTRKIFDSCKDKDCIEDLRVYPTRSSQTILDQANCVKAGQAELLYAYINVEPISFNKGFYTVDVRYFYRITGDAFTGAARPSEFTGLAVFNKRAVLFGSEGSAKVFTSTAADCVEDEQGAPAVSSPLAVVESVDPLILGMKLMTVGDCCPCDCGVTEIPAFILAQFPEALVTEGDLHRLYVTLGQFSIIRLERDTQLLIPAYDYCVPEKECSCDDGRCEEPDPCQVFRQVQFPVEEFFPPNALPTPPSGYREVRACCR